MRSIRIGAGKWSVLAHKLIMSSLFVYVMKSAGAFIKAGGVCDQARHVSPGGGVKIRSMSSICVCHEKRRSV